MVATSCPKYPTNPTRSMTPAPTWTTYREATPVSPMAPTFSEYDVDPLVPISPENTFISPSMPIPCVMRLPLADRFDDRGGDAGEHADDERRGHARGPPL
jgi:hypothetical protein